MADHSRQERLGCTASTFHLLLVLLALSTPLHAETSRVSVASDGSQANAFSGPSSISGDGRFAAFASLASNLAPGDTAQTNDVFLHDRGTGQTRRIASGMGNSGVLGTSLSADGRFLAYTYASPAGSYQVYVYDRITGLTECASVALDGSVPTINSYLGQISADGRYVAFTSSVANLVSGDTNGAADIFVRDRTTATTRRVSIATNGAQANGRSSTAVISADGRFVAFVSGASNLVPGDTHAATDVFLHDAWTGETTRVSVASSGAQTAGISLHPAISGDGRFVSFQSFDGTLVPGDNNSRWDVFLHDRRSRATSLISRSPGGSLGNGHSQNPVLSLDGSGLAYLSGADNLVAGDSNGFNDVFRYDVKSGATTRLSVSTSGSQGNGQCTGGPLELGLSADSSVAIFTCRASNLVPGDTNGIDDIFVRDLGPLADPLDHLELTTIPSPQAVGTPFPVTITARSSTGAMVHADLDLRLTAIFGQVSPIEVHLESGTATFQAVLDSPGRGIVLAAYGGGVVGESNAFDATGGPAAVGALAGVVLAQETSFAVRGSAADLPAAAPAAGVTVTLSSSSGSDTRITDANGAYSFSGKPCDTYNLVATNGQTTTPGMSIRIPCGSTITADLLLAGCPAGVPPVLLIPGILGSTTPGAWITPRLPARSPDTFSSPEWGPWSDHWLLNRASGLHDPFGAAGWRNLAAALKAANPSLSIGCSILPVPYDWRMPLDEAVKKYLIPAIDQAKLHTGSAKVYLVAHSMGGLLARAYIQGDGYAQRNDVDKLAMVGTPNLGAATAYLMWQGGDPWTGDSLAFDLQGDFFSKLRHLPTVGFYTETTQNQSRILRRRPILTDPTSRQPSSHPRSLLTSDIAALYHESVDALLQLEPTWPVLIPRGELACPAMTGVPWTNTWLWSKNQPSAARDRMVKEDNADPAKVRTKIFAGTGHQTIGYLPAGAAQCNAALFPDGKPDVVPSAAVSKVQLTLGDGTVPLFSAHGGNGPTALGSRVSYFSPQKVGEHSGLIDTYKCEILSFLLGSVPCTPSVAAVAAKAGASGALSVAVHGRPQPYVTTPGGAASGINPATGARETGAAGSAVVMQADSGVVSLPNPVDGTYQVSFSSVHEEDFVLEIAYVNEGDSEAEEATSFYAGPSSVRFTFNAAASPAIVIDHSPAPPTGPQADVVDAGGRYTRLSWTAHGDPLVTGYNIYGKLESSPQLAKIGATSGTAFTPGDHWADDASQAAHVYAISAYYADGSESFLSEFVMNDDRDHDGLTDTEEARAGTSPDSADSDGDGLADGDEVRRGTSPLLTDTDGDGYTDFREVQGQGDPLDPASLPGFELFTVAPCRLLDTRSGSALASGSDRLFTAPGRCGIPASARAISVNLTVVGSTGAGHVIVYPGNLATPNASIINFAAGQTRANNAVIRLATNGTGTFLTRPFVAGGGTVHLIIDVNGYFQ